MLEIILSIKTISSNTQLMLIASQWTKSWFLPCSFDVENLFLTLASLVKSSVKSLSLSFIIDRKASLAFRVINVGSASKASPSFSMYLFGNPQRRIFDEISSRQSTLEFFCLTFRNNAETTSVILCSPGISYRPKYFIVSNSLIQLVLNLFHFSLASI